MLQAGILQPLLSLNTLVKMGSLGSVGLHGELPNLASFPPDTQGMGGEGLMQQEPGLAGKCSHQWRDCLAQGLMLAEELLVSA